MGARWWLSFLALAGCSSEAIAEPIPAIERPGTFVAVDEGKGYLTLHRTLESFRVNDETLLVLTVYDVAPATPGEAREIAKDRDIPVLYETAATSLGAFPNGPYWIVWFRSLTEEELARLQ